MNPNYFILTVYILVGCIILLGAIFNWDWFYTARNLRFITNRFGRKWARVAYGVVGVIVIVQAALLLHSVINSTT